MLTTNTPLYPMSLAKGVCARFIAGNPGRRGLAPMVVVAVLVGLMVAACGEDVATVAEPEVVAPAETTETTAAAPSEETSEPAEADVSTDQGYVDPLDVPSPAEQASAPQALMDFPTETERTGNEILAPEFVGLEGWINSDPLTLGDLRGKVVLVDFWTYTCINCIRTLPYLRDWHQKYESMGLVILGVHAPEFEFEKVRDNVVMAVGDQGIEYAVAQDNDHGTWGAFRNRFWPAKYLIDRDGYIRYTHFGEGMYLETEVEIRKLLAEIGADVTKVAPGSIPEPAIDERAQSSPDPQSNQTRELYAGFMRNYNALRSGSQPYVRHQEFYQGPEIDGLYFDPGDHQNHFIYLNGLWHNGFEELVHARATIDYEDYVAIMFSAIEANVVLSLDGVESYDVRVTIDGQPLDPSQAGGDIQFDAEGNSYVHVTASDIYHLVQLPEYGTHELKISSNSAGFAVFAYTFGSYLEGPEP